ncbi:SWIM zinc finger family protein [Haladaptatus pallidirubidus]|uniref:SWIM-type domain-containing protein n=1 Tax=Haladaptatus pallidirubidus TaxID=1008152 RepID=A0AAV3UIS2_9EURY|nr:SWIM zinc finger family protein [Haladaptatus pallidirubidus]
MSTKPSAGLESDETAQKPAQAEQFSYSIEVPGMVDVTNESHENPADHQYTVSIDDVTDELMACTCPHHIHCNAYCKHLAVVAERNGSHEVAAFNTNSDNIRDSPRQFIVLITRSGDLWLGGGKVDDPTSIPDYNG